MDDDNPPDFLSNVAEGFRLLNTAMGMLMHQETVDQRTAYGIICAASDRTGRSTAQVSASYLATGTWRG